MSIVIIMTIFIYLFIPLQLWPLTDKTYFLALWTGIVGKLFLVNMFVWITITMDFYVTYRAGVCHCRGGLSIQPTVAVFWRYFTLFKLKFTFGVKNVLLWGSTHYKYSLCFALTINVGYVNSRTSSGQFFGCM